MGLKSKHETRRQNRPVMEALEGRIVLSTFQATTVTQLQADIAAVNNTSGPNTILLKPGVYLMTSALQIQNAGNLTIRPSSTRSTTSLVGSVVDRVLEIDGGSVTLSGLSISGGGAVRGGRHSSPERLADTQDHKGLRQHQLPVRSRHLHAGRLVDPSR